MYLFSIITATYNAEKTLPTLLDSLSSQTCKDFELIIQDGASSDRTLEIIEQYQGKLAHISVQSEPDEGIYDAWNKALQRVQGQWVLFLGADDSLYGNSALQKADRVVTSTPSYIQFVSTSTLLLTQEGHAFETLRPAAGAYKQLANGMSLPHPSLFYRASILHGQRFSTDYKVAGDYELLCRTLKKDNYLINPLVTTQMVIGGVSGSLPTMLHSELECLRASKRYFPQAFPWKLYAKILRSAGFRLVAKLGNEKAGQYFADMFRKMQGKPSIWSCQNSGISLPAWNTQPLFSLIVATVGRKETLKCFLQALEKQTYSHFEVLIADQNPPEMLDAMLHSFTSRLDIKRISLPPAGVSAARNALLPLAKGDIIAFPDDDCWYAPHTLEHITSQFTLNPHAGGMLCAWEEKEREVDVSINNVSRFSAFTDAGTLVQFYRKEALKNIQFDPELGPGTGLPYGCGEDTDLLLQVLATGAPVIRTSEVLVHHPKPNVTDPALPAKAKAYALGRMHLLRKHTFPLWFKLANVLYPLLRLPLEGKKAWAYRKAMFLGRLKGLLHLR